MIQSTQLRPIETRDIPAYWAHLERLVLESGRDGDFIFSPLEKSENCNLEEFSKSCEQRWAKPPTDVNWERTWILTDDEKIYGEINLVHRPPLASCLHRATLMMGIERSHRRQGWGAKMLNTAIDWAQAQPGLDWLQLYVFEGNTPAKTMYRKFGFRECGTTPDMFRVFGQRIDDTLMVLKLREAQLDRSPI